MTVQITLVEDLEALRPRAGEWNALVRQGTTNTPFQTFEWNLAWWRAFGSDAQLLVLLAEDSGTLVGIAPLMIVEQRIFGRSRKVIEFIGTHAADYSDFIAAPNRRPVVELMLQWLETHQDRWDLLHLINIAETSPLRELVPQALSRHGQTVQLERLYECPTRVLGDREADRKATRKKSIREHYNKLARLGQVNFQWYSTADEIERCLEPFFQQHIDRWKDTPTPSFFSDERQRRFYREVARLLGPHGWVIFTAVSLDDKPLSYHFGYDYEGRIFVIKWTFNPEFGQYAPGMLQVRFLIEHAMEHNAKEVDFTAGEERYKYRFSNHARVNYAARVHPASMFFGMDRLLRYAKAASGRAPGLRRLGGRLLKPLLGDSFRRLGL
jgi:CelD/BcsL family acetyltransferase involved in cellulose biosynthesis